MNVIGAGMNEQFLSRLLDDFQKEQTGLYNELKKDSNEDKRKQINFQKQLSIINSCITGIIKLVKLKKDLKNTD